MSFNYSDAKKYIRAVSTVKYIEERPFIIAIVELSSSTIGRTLVAKGLSTCSPTDRWDTKMGQDVARGRAEAKLARRVMRATAQRQKAKLITIATLPITTSEGDFTVNYEAI